MRTRALWVLTVLVGSALAGELALRVLRPDSLQYYYDLKRLHSYNPDYLVGLAPNEDRTIRHHQGLWTGRFTTNSLGYRGSREPDGSPVLACLGDSLVMGFGVSDHQTFCSKLDGTVLGGRKHQSMNLGVDAFGSVGDQKRLTEAAGRLNLSVVLFFVSPNDFTMPPELTARGVKWDDQVDQERRDHPELLKYFRIQFELTRVSYLLHALKLSSEQLSQEAVMRKRSVHNQLVRAGILSPGPDDAAPSGFGKYIASQFYAFPPHKQCRPVAPPTAVAAVCPEPVPADIQCLASEPAASALEELPPITQESYLKMMDLAKAQGFKLVPVFLPVQVEEIYCGMHGNSHSLHNYAVRARAFFEKHNVTTIDLMPHVGEICGLPDSRVRDQVIPGDGHLTISGNAWAASSIQTELSRLEARHAF